MIETVIAEYADGSNSVKVTFDCSVSGISHIRDVNIVLDENGKYDPHTTALRVQEVAMGVHHKIQSGVITASSIEPSDEVVIPQPLDAKSSKP